jgi:hypothetical protein
MRRWLVRAAVSVVLLVLAGCAASTAVDDGQVPTGSSVVEPADSDGDPNAVGRALAATTATVAPSNQGMSVGSAGVCANEMLAESMARAVEGGASVVLGSGNFTGNTRLSDGEIGMPYSEVTLTVESTLAGSEVQSPASAWVYGDLAGAGNAATTGETSSLWARGGRLVAVVDAQSDWPGLPGPVIRVTPVVGEDVIMSWVGCWSTQGVDAREFDGAVDLFDDQGMHPTELQLYAVSLDDFRSVLPR